MITHLFRFSALFSSRFGRSLGPVWSVAVLIFMAALTPSASAANRFWTGAVNGNLSNASNYNPAGTPVAGDDLIFQANSLVTRLVVTNDFSPNRAFETITFQGSNYVIRGNALLVTNGITSINSFGPNTIDADVDVRISQIWTATGPLATLDFNGDINLNANTLTVRAATGDFFFSGIVSGTGNLVKTNVGTLRMDGSAGHNTYSGFTRFDGGVLELDKFSIFPVATNFISISGDLTIGDGNGLVGTDVLRLLADDQIANTSDVTVKNSGLFDLNDRDDRIASLTMQGGTVDTGTGTLFLGGNLTTLADNNTALVEGHLSLGGASRTFDINSGPPGADCRINAIISSDTVILFTTAGFTKTGGGSLFLAGTNTYNGTTTINEGQVALLADRALGATTTPLGASAGTVVNGDGNLFLSGVQVTNEDLTINSSNPGGAFNASGASIWTGDILLNTDTFISSSGSFFLLGPITGVGGFTKLSTGSLTLAGTNANTYTGTTTVRDGTLLLDKDPADGAMNGPLVVGEDELPEDADVVRWLRCCQLPIDTDITVNASGLVDLDGFDENMRNLTLNGGDVDAPAPFQITPYGDITVNRNTNSQANITGRMNLVSSPIIDVTGHFFSPDLKIDATLLGAGGFTKNGVGEVGLTASNIYSGTTTVNDGLLIVDDSSALGTAVGGTVVNGGAVLALRFDVHIGTEALALAGTGQSGFGALSSSFGSNSWAGTVTLSANATISVDTGDFLNLSGAIGSGGGFNLTKTGTGTLTFSGGSANTFNNMSVNAGTLLLNKTIVNAAFVGDLGIGDGTGTDTVRLLTDDQIPDTSTVTMASGAVFDLNNQSETTGSIGGFGQLDLGTAILREGLDDGSSTFAGSIVGTGQVFKLGTGTWTLDGNNSYSGRTTVSAGILVVNGSQATSDVTVNGSATLSGDGIVSDLDVFGNLRPGSSPAILTTSNFVFHSSASDFFVELNGPAAGTGYDQVNVRGNVGLSNATLHATLGFPSAISNSFTIINNDGADAVNGTFNGLAQGATVFVSGVPFRISYTGGSGNDVVLTQLLGLPVLNIRLVQATNVVLSWSTNFTGFLLEANTNLNTSIWNGVVPAPVFSGTNNVVTNTASGTQKYYRLHHP